MYVRRLRLYGVKSLHIDLPTSGEALSDYTRRRLLLEGANGSGKTTILDCIRLLWERFGDWIDWGPRRAELMNGRHRERLSPTDAALDNAELAALELGDLPIVGKTLWIGVGQQHAWENLKRQYPTAEFAGLIRSNTNLQATHLELPPGDWTTFRQRSMVGSSPQGNIVYFPPDNRTPASPPQQGARLIDTTQFNWSTVLNPQLDLDSVMLTIRALRPEAFAETLSLVNLALRQRNKRLVGFGDDKRLMIEGQTDDGATFSHPAEYLSSSEQQVLLLLVYTVGFLRPGGILLVDEPALYLHIALAGLLTEMLDIVARQRKGQLMVVSHADWVRELFSREEEKINLTPWRRGKT